MNHLVLHTYSLEPDGGSASPAWWRWFTRGVAWLLSQVILITAILVPHNQAMAGTSTTTWTKPAPTGAALGNWTEFSAQTQNWIERPDPLLGFSQSILVPRDNFELIGQADWVPPSANATATQRAALDWQMILGDKWISLGRESIGQAGLSDSEVSDARHAFPANTHYVFVQYSPQNATAHITIQRVAKTPMGKIEVRVADFTPHHGQHWKAAGKYRTQSEIEAKVAGYNPFANFAGSSGDPLFYNLSWEALKVAVGHAMRMYRASVGYIALADQRVEQFTQKKKSGFLKKKIITTVNGYAKPRWYIATPMDMQGGGETGQICVTGGGASTTTSSCDAPEHVAISGAIFMEWKGGNMPADEEHVYQWVQEKSSFTVIFFAIVLSLVTWGVASVLMPALGVTSIMGMGAAGLAAAVGAGYALASTVFHSGGSLTQAQGGLFGETGNGVLSVDNNTEQGAGIAAAIQANMIRPQMGAGGMIGTDKLYRGDCPLGYTVQQCEAGGLDPGSGWRPDSYVEYNSTKAMRQRMQYCTGLGLSGEAARRCTAPATD